MTATSIPRRQFFHYLGLASLVAAIDHGTIGAIVPGLRATTNYGMAYGLAPQPTIWTPPDIEALCERLQFHLGETCQHLWTANRIVCEPATVTWVLKEPGPAADPFSLGYTLGCKWDGTPAKALDFTAYERAARMWREGQPHLNDLLHQAWLTAGEPPCCQGG